MEKKYTDIKNSKYSEEEFSKLAFLYAMIEHNLKYMNSKSTAGKKKTPDFRVGFIFFDDCLTILKAAKQKNIPMYVHNSEYAQEEWPFTKEKVDFNSFKAI